MFTDNAFHNIGVASTIDGKPDLGRHDGVALYLADEFNCVGPWSDAPASACTRAGGAVRLGDSSTVQAFRTPSLRNVTRRPPYGHAGQFATLEAAIEHHNQAPAAHGGKTELAPLGLSQSEIRLLAAFLQTLESREIFLPPSQPPVGATLAR
jgi:cytochrome c peroxidase